MDLLWEWYTTLHQYGFSDELSKESTTFSSSSHNTVTTQVTFCRDAGLFTIATIATQVFQQISLRRCTKTHQPPYICSRNRLFARKPCVAVRKQFTVMLFCSRRTFSGHFSCVAVRVWTTVTFLGGNMTQWSVNSMLDSVFTDLCVDYGPGNDTVVLRSPVKPGMTVLSLCRYPRSSRGWRCLNIVL